MAIVFKESLVNCLDVICGGYSRDELSIVYECVLMIREESRIL